MERRSGLQADRQCRASLFAFRKPYDVQKYIVGIVAYEKNLKPEINSIRWQLLAGSGIGNG